MLIIGHRGARGLAPENTIAGFKKALEHKVDQIEFDVRVTNDNIPILYHGSVLTDPSGNKLRIENHTYQDLKQHKTDLATLEDSLKAIHGKVPLCIEVKRGVTIGPVVQVLRTYKQSYRIGSKSQRTLRQLHQQLPTVAKIVIENWSGIQALRRAKQVNAKCLSMNKFFLWWGFIRAINRRGYELYAYTLNNPKKARRWAKYGLAGVVTDYPDRFKR